MTTSERGKDGSIWFQYRFASPDHPVREFEVRLDPDTLGLLAPPRAEQPSWTALSHHQCSNCPLKPADHLRCPAAVNLAPVVEAFPDTLSYEPTDIEIRTEQRTYRKHAPLQDGLSALVGIYMVTSGCPHLDKLRPLVATHLPFASHLETTYRAITMYLLAQFYRRQRGQTPDWDLEGLREIYEEVTVVNRCFHARIMGVHATDACLNAIFRLDCYAQFTNRQILRKNLDHVTRFFGTLLDK